MYNVMVADDDYPVLELLSEAVDWKGMDLRLLGAHEDGLSAWRQAQEVMPDILITDIGMPKMDGLELIRRLKERNSNLRVAILSCHDEFHYAQKAMRLNVQDYLLKDSFNPRELEQLLARFIRNLKEETLSHSQRDKLQQLVSGTEELRKEKWLKNALHQPLIDPEQFAAELRDLGILAAGEACLPVLGFIDGYALAKKRFMSDQTLRFAVSNVLEEMLRGAPIKVIHIGYSAKLSVLFFCYRPTLKTNIFDQIADSLKAVQSSLNRTLKLGMSFLIEDRQDAPEKLRLALHRLIDNENQRFYMKKNSIDKLKPPEASADDLYAYFDQAGAELKELILGKSESTISALAERWVDRMEKHRFAPEIVKDWMLKLLIDQRLKLQSMNLIQPGHTNDALLKEIAESDSLEQLKLWLVQYLQSFVDSAAGDDTGGGSMHPEVLKACQYVALHLEKRISLDEIAEHLYLNPSYFSRLFKKETGENFIEYVTRMKMEKAKELLNQSGSSIGSISETLGYEHPSYFIKIFKGYTGMTPVEFRG